MDHGANGEHPPLRPGLLANGTEAHQRDLTPQTLGQKAFEEKRYYFASRAVGGYPFVGTPDRIADELATLSRSGIRGIAFSMVNYLAELPLFRDEVLPRLARLGVREKN